MRIAMMPATRNDSHTADPAFAAATPISAKMPAPTIEPTPSATAPHMVIARFGPPSLNLYPFEMRSLSLVDLGDHQNAHLVSDHPGTVALAAGFFEKGNRACGKRPLFTVAYANL